MGGFGAPAMDGDDAIEDAVKVLLHGLGEDSDRDGLRKTPSRVAKAFREGTRGYRQNVEEVVQGALFPETGLDDSGGLAGGVGGLVVVRDINLFSYCESCLLPFKVQCHVGYIPSSQRVVGLSKLSRVADIFAKRLQEPQRLASELSSALQSSIKPTGVAVVLKCWHIKYPEYAKSCHEPFHPAKVPMQGWVLTSVLSGSGVFESEDSDYWEDYLAVLKLSGINIEKKLLPAKYWCPGKCVEVPFSNGHCMRKLSNCKTPELGISGHGSMINAAAAIIRCLGEDLTRKELVGTPYRFVHWLLKFQQVNSEIEFNVINGAGDKIVVCNSKLLLHELNLSFCSQCEHHLIPFYGVVHIGYFHGDNSKNIERSVLQSVVHFFGSKLQVQERLTRQIAETVSSQYGLSGVMVVVEASHICMISRGIEKMGSNTATIAVTGRFTTDVKSKARFLEIISENINSSPG